MLGEVKLNFGSKVRTAYYLNVKGELTFSNITTTLNSTKLAQHETENALNL
jgi:hypothetical protein